MGQTIGLEYQRCVAGLHPVVHLSLLPSTDALEFAVVSQLLRFLHVEILVLLIAPSQVNAVSTPRKKGSPVQNGVQLIKSWQFIFDLIPDFALSLICVHKLSLQTMIICNYSPLQT